MTGLLKFLIAATAFQIALVTGAFAAEEIGKAVAVTVTVTGDDRPLSASSAIHRDERVRTSSSGTGQFMFRDGTKLAVGPNSSLVLDQSIFSGSSSFKKLTLNATRGTFRWVSGKSSSAAYKINTPFGTLGVRGTVFDVYIGSSTAAVVLLEGSAVFCGNDGVCKPLTRGCDIVRANRNGVMDEKPSKTAVNGVKNEESFPFLMGTRKLSRPFRVGGGRCGLSASVRVLKKGGDEPGPGNRSDPLGPPAPSPLIPLAVRLTVRLIPGNCIRQQVFVSRRFGKKLPMNAARGYDPHALAVRVVNRPGDNPGLVEIA